MLNRRCSTIGCILQYSNFEHDHTYATELTGNTPARTKACMAPIFCTYLQASLLLYPQESDRFLTFPLKLLWVGGEKSETRSRSDVKQEKFSQVPKGFFPRQRFRFLLKKYHYCLNHTELIGLLVLYMHILESVIAVLGHQTR